MPAARAVQTPLFQIAYFTTTLALFCAIAFLTRAKARRVLGASCAVLVFTALSAPIDTFALRAGFWTYPACASPPHPTLPVYLGQALVFVGCLALVAWRVQRRFGARGVAVLAPSACVAGLVRDLSVAALLPDVIRFGDAPASVLADLGAWAIVVLVALAVPRVVSGAARADALRG